MKQIIIIPGILGSNLNYGKCPIWPPTEMEFFVKGLVVAIRNLSDIATDKITTDSIDKGTYNELYEFITEAGSDLKVDRFPYDWRKNNFDANTMEELMELIVDTSADEVILVAHSMGGILSKLFLLLNKDNEYIKKVKKLITIGTPWKGSPKAYIKLKYGIGAVHMPHVFKSTIPKLPSVYQLLPNKCYTENKGFIANKDWNDIYKEYVDILRKNGFNHNKILSELYEKMNENIPNWIEHHEIIGYSKPTLTSIRDVGAKVFGEHGDGDGTVPLFSAISDTKYKYFIKSEHTSLPTNCQVKEILREIIFESNSMECINDKLHLQTYQEILDNGFEGKVVRVACPVNVSLIDENGEMIYGDLSKVNTDNFLKLLLGQSDNIEYIDGDVYFIFNNKNDLTSNKLLVQAYEEGAVSIAVEEYKNGRIGDVAKFKTFNMDYSKNAEVIINNELDNCNVKLFGDGEKKITRIILKGESQSESNKNIILPKTEYNFIGENIVEVDTNKYLAIGNVEIYVDKVIEGTYDVLDTFYSVNCENVKSISEKEKYLLDLKLGDNLIKIYSTDKYENVELINEIYIYHIDSNYDRLPFLKVKMGREKYTLITEFNESKDLEKFNLIVPKVEFLFNDNDGVLFNYIEIKNKMREVKLKVTDSFGTLISDSFIVDEKLLNLIIDSKATLSELKKFLKLLRLNDFKRFKVIRNGVKKSYKVLTNERVTDADSLEFENSTISINIDKMKEYRIMFSNMSEYFNLSENEFKQQFSIFSNNSTKEILGLKLKIYLAVEDNSETTQFTNLDCIEYSIKDNRYNYNISSEKIKKHLSNLKLNPDMYEYEYNAIYFLIYIDNEENTLLRACKIEIKY
ncbi:lipase/acyltransferase domain-containing protein [Inconstantimicrobium mannanitabidum]|uniref:Uncharacterized protein n=1 Tax=Inconstantimicrobium mannanitabidum TaxID=1604901 RepID=A0ACB5RFC2_9CLOT|nr:hypothetical protein [Clostridium sp. TW13]GKX67697.1 hypothetical protein rsdtw13_29550 [Clostridium sp. TW13]